MRDARAAPQRRRRHADRRLHRARPRAWARGGRRVLPHARQRAVSRAAAARRRAKPPRIRRAPTRPTPPPPTSRGSISTRSCPASRSRRSRPRHEEVAGPRRRSSRPRTGAARTRPRTRRRDKARRQGAGKGGERRKPTTAAKLPERFWLQAGSFASESDAENLKARLAFAGWQASIQQGTLPDKGTRYRVRLGPYDNTDELNAHPQRSRQERLRGRRHQVLKRTVRSHCQRDRSDQAHEPIEQSRDLHAHA